MERIYKHRQEDGVVSTIAELCYFKHLMFILFQTFVVNARNVGVDVERPGCSV